MACFARSMKHQESKYVRLGSAILADARYELIGRKIARYVPRAAKERLELGVRQRFNAIQSFDFHFLNNTPGSIKKHLPRRKDDRIAML